MIPPRMLRLTPSGIIVIVVIIVIAVGTVIFGFIKRGPVGNAVSDPILKDEYSLYVLDPGPFEIVGPEDPIQKEFMIMASGDTEIAFGSVPGAYFSEDESENQLTQFGNETIRNSNWLPGCQRWQLEAAEVMIGTNEYYYITLLARRDPEWTGRLESITKLVHEREIERYQPDADMIVRLYYILKDRDIYTFTLSGSPEDVAVLETQIRTLLASVRLSATDAMLELELK